MCMSFLVLSLPIDLVKRIISQCDLPSMTALLGQYVVVVIVIYGVSPVIGDCVNGGEVVTGVIGGGR